MPPRDEEYVSGAEFDSDLGEEDVSDDSDDFHSLPTLSAGTRASVAERVRQREAPRSAKRARKGAQEAGGYSWEAAYKRSWDQVHEDEGGNLDAAVRHMLEAQKRQRRSRDAVPVQRGIIRHLVLVLDLSSDMMELDLRPNRFDLTLQYVKRFVTDYFDQNPIGQLAIVCTRDGLAERLSLMGGNTTEHIAALSSRRRLEPRGEPSLQNALDMARSALVHLPASNTREILVISASLTSVDPGNIHDTIKQLAGDGIHVSVISLAAEMHVLRELATRTGGEMGVVMNEDHYEELLQKFVPPRVLAQGAPSAEDAAGLLVMGFPRRLPFNAPASLCACHGRVVSKSAADDDGDPAGYTCPRCLARVCQVPTDCPICGITIVMSTHLARSYHHLFPVENYVPLGWDMVSADSPAACFSCSVPFPKMPTQGADAESAPPLDAAAIAPSSRYRCPRCRREFCLECDAFVQEQLHLCPGYTCEHEPPVRDARRMSDILDAYQRTASVEGVAPHAGEDFLPASQPPSYETNASAIPLISAQAAPPLNINNGAGLPVTGDVASAGAAPQERRIRWDTSMNTGRQRAGPTVTVRRTTTQNSQKPVATGIQRRNHPGPISLAGLQPTIVPEAVRPVTDVAATDAVDLEDDDEDHENLAALANELEHFDDEGERAQAIANETGVAVIDPAAFEHGLQTPASELGEEYVGLGSQYTSTIGDSASEASYDPMRDADLAHLDMIPGETDGMPVRRSRRRRRRSAPRVEASESRWTKLRRALGFDDDNVFLEDAAEKGALGADATNLKSVPVQTSSGIRGGGRGHASRFERKALELVKAHKLLGGEGKSELDEIPSIDRSHLPDSTATTPDALETAEQLDPRPVAASGVLGQLLKLYDNDVPVGSETTSLHESSTGLPAVPVAAAAAGASDISEKHTVTPGGTATSPGGVSHMSGRPQSIYHSATHQAATIGSASGRMIKGVAHEAGIDIDERPKAARSSAGVFGALIATTGNLIGAVSPNHAQLGPNPKRPGYTLDRYMLPELDEKTLRRTAKIVSDRGAPMSRDQAMQARRSMDTARDSIADDTGKLSSDLSSTPIKGGKHSISNKLRHMSGVHTPDVLSSMKGDYFDDADSRAKAEWAKKLKKRRKQRKQQEIYITMHVAAILQRQEFILKLSRCLMMFGAPTHRIETQIQQTATVLEINCRCVYFPNLMLLSFGDETTHTSETKIIKQGSVLDLTKLTDMHTVYWNVIHDKIGVDVACKQLDKLMLRKPFIRKLPLVMVGGFASGVICFSNAGFAGSFLDALVAAALGAFLVFCQLTITTELYSNVFEIVFATFNSFIALAFHSIPGRLFCYKPIVSASIVLILPGFIVLSGALELQSKNIVSGSVRLVYAVIYSVLLGVGISIGSLPAASIEKISAAESDASCALMNRMLNCSGDGNCRPDNWYTSVGTSYFGFLTVPAYASMLSLRNQAKFNRKEFPTMVLIACAGWLTSHIHVLMGKSRANVPAALQEPYMTAAIGSFTVGILAHVYGRIFDGRSFVVAVPGILYQLPTGLNTVKGSNGLLDGAGQNSTDSASFGSDAVTNGFSIGTQLLNVALGITIGIFCSTILMHILGGRKIRGGGMFSF
ncbi:hypothetical protein MCUN1_000037 [Malassezia cuniculi]|uniref:VWFA domain-containing protein n=1 Tax=Malassezia cuniculi TaxID=948313 RepID=A0AAF0J5C3_9BASI|nr:hypothetical protein MCUN1_000037 [Malassezia cuniculi]